MPSPPHPLTRRVRALLAGFGPVSRRSRRASLPSGMSDGRWKKPGAAAIGAMVVWALLLSWLLGGLPAEITGVWQVWVLTPKLLVFAALAWYGWSKGAVVVLIVLQGAQLVTLSMLAAAFESTASDATDAGLAVLLLPYVDAALLGAAIAGIEIGLAVERRRPAPLTHCTRCGYDLAGLKGGVCPECGLWMRLMKR